MKGKFLRRIALVLTLAMILSSISVPSTTVEAKQAETKWVKDRKKGHTEVCTCPYCSLTFKVKAGKVFPEGKTPTKKTLKKYLTVYYRGKKTNNWSVESSVVKWKKGGKFKVTIKKGNVKKKVAIRVNRIMAISIKQCKLLPIPEGKPFPTKEFKKKTQIIVEYRYGNDKTFKNYSLKVKKYKKYWLATASWKSSGRTVKTSIRIPIIAVVKPPASLPPVAVVTAKPTSKPTTVPTTSSSADPTKIPTATPSADPTTTPTVTPTATPIVSADPTTTPTATPIVSADPTTTPTATPIVSADPSSAPTLEPEKEFHPVTLNGFEIIRYTEGSIDLQGRVSENTHLYVKAVVPFGQYFVNATNEREEIVSIEELFDFRVKGPTTLTANFSSQPVEKEPAVHFSGNAYKFLPEKKTVRLFMSIEIPEGWEKIEYGFVYSSEKLSADQMILGVAKKIIDEESTTTGSADFTYDARFLNQAIWDAGEYRYFRPFGIVKDRNGNTKTIYGDFILSVQLKMPATN